MRKKFNKRLAEVEIQSLSPKGNGLGSYLQDNGQKGLVEVPFTMPGDIVNAFLMRKNRGKVLGLLEEVVQPAVLRIMPPRCRHFGSCGGCRWQHIPYEKQLQLKEDGIRQQFSSLLAPSTIFRPILGCEPPWNYRNKMEFSFSNDAAGTKFLGLIMDSSRGKVLNLTECHLVNPWFIECLEAVRSWWVNTELQAYHPSSNAGSLRTLTLREGRRTADRLAMLTVSGNPDYALKNSHLESFKALFRRVNSFQDKGEFSLFLRIQQIAKGTATNFYEMHLDGQDHIKEQLEIFYEASSPPASLQFKISPSAFFQPNSYQAERLYSLALQLTSIAAGSIVYDLYCGTGTLAICASKIASQVVGVELSLESSLDARENAKMNGCDNVTILTGDVQKVLAEIKEKKSFPLPDLVIVDPPRAGLDAKAIAHLLELRANKILYISCNPATQAADIANLIQGGYSIRVIQPIDQFPQTTHVENIAILELNP